MKLPSISQADSKTVQATGNISALTTPSVNEADPGSAKIVKTSEDGVVEGVTFTITGNGINQTLTTDVNGEVQIDDLKPGTYQVKETMADKYEPQETRSVVVVSNQVATVTFNNVLKRGELQVIKTSEDNLVEGVKFHLYGTSLSGLKVDEYAVTDKNGVATFKDVLISGHESYTLEEVDTAERYIVPESQRTAIEWNVVTEKSFYNELKRGDLIVKKTSEDGFIEGMTFHLFGTSLSGIEVDEYATTDSDGIAYFNDILIGTGFTIEEVNTPVRYVIPDRQTADIAWDELTEVEFENILKKWRADVYKLDAELAGENGGMPEELMPMALSITPEETVTRGSWRNAFYIECNTCPYGNGNCNGYLLTTDTEGTPLLLSVLYFEKATGEKIDKTECVAVISKEAFESLFNRWLVWNVNNPKACSILQLIPNCFSPASSALCVYW